jgi:formate dehydrogenase subunit gamma
VALHAILERHEGHEGALLPILNDVQVAFGFISEDAIRGIAHALNLSRAEVYGVVSFYHDYRMTAAPHPVIKLCRAEACQARGVEALVADAEARAKGRVEIEAVYCLGLCSVGPAAMAGHEVIARLDASKLAALIEAVA